MLLVTKHFHPGTIVNLCMIKKVHHISVSERMQEVFPKDTLHGSYLSEHTKMIQIHGLLSIISDQSSKVCFHQLKDVGVVSYTVGNDGCRKES